MGVVLISQNVAEMVRDTIIEHSKLFPTILEIPAKEQVYEPEKDYIVQRAAAILWGQETGIAKIKEISAQVQAGGVVNTK